MLVESVLNRSVITNLRDTNKTFIFWRVAGHNKLGQVVTTQQNLLVLLENLCLSAR